MTNANHPKQGSKTRFRISLLLLTGLLIAKLFWTLGSRANSSDGDQATAQTGSIDGGFTPVGDENAKVWGLAGSLLNLFNGGTPSREQYQSDENQRLLQERADNKRHWEEYDQRRAEEREERKQEMYDRQQQQRAEEQQRYDQQQQEYYDRRKEEQGF